MLVPNLMSKTQKTIFLLAIPTNAADALRAITADCEATHDAAVHTSRTHFQLNVDHGDARVSLVGEA